MNLNINVLTKHNVPFEMDLFAPKIPEGLDKLFSAYPCIPRNISKQQIIQTLMHTLLRSIRSLTVGAGAVALQPKAALRIPAKYMSGLSNRIHEKRFTHRLPAIEAPQPMENHFSRPRKSQLQGKL